MTTPRGIVELQPDVPVLTKSEVTRGAWRYDRGRREVEFWLELQTTDGTERSSNLDSYAVRVTHTDNTTQVITSASAPALYVGLESASPAISTTPRWYTVTGDGLRAGFGLTSGQQPFGTGMDEPNPRRDFNDSIFQIPGTKAVKWIDLIWNRDGG